LFRNNFFIPEQFVLFVSLEQLFFFLYLLLVSGVVGVAVDTLMHLRS